MMDGLLTEPDGDNLPSSMKVRPTGSRILVNGHEAVFAIGYDVEAGVVLLAMNLVGLIWTARICGRVTVEQAN